MVENRFTMKDEFFKSVVFEPIARQNNPREERTCINCNDMFLYPPSIKTVKTCDSCRGVFSWTKLKKLVLDSHVKFPVFNDSYVECKICKYRAKEITRHVGTHNISNDEYINQYGELRSIGNLNNIRAGIKDRPAFAQPTGPQPGRIKAFDSRTDNMIKKYDLKQDRNLIKNIIVHFHLELNERSRNIIGRVLQANRFNLLNEYVHCIRKVIDYKDGGKGDITLRAMIYGEEEVRARKDKAVEAAVKLKMKKAADPDTIIQRARRTAPTVIKNHKLQWSLDFVADVMELTIYDSHLTNWSRLLGQMLQYQEFETPKQAADQYAKIHNYTGQRKSNYGWYSVLLGHEEAMKRMDKINVNRSQMYSKISQELFNSLLVSGYPVIKWESIFYATKKSKGISKNNNEYKLLTSDNKHCYPDFIDLSRKLIIEFDGSYWHGTEKSKLRDKEKDTEYAKLGFNVIRVPEFKYKNNKEQTVIEIIEQITILDQKNLK